MRYIAVDWLHDEKDEPVRLYHEIDDGGYERRKVEEFRDGTLRYADATRTDGSTFLAWEPLPSNQEIASDPQFRVREITAQQFGSVWKSAMQGKREPVARA